MQRKPKTTKTTRGPRRTSAVSLGGRRTSGPTTLQVVALLSEYLGLGYDSEKALEDYDGPAIDVIEHGVLESGVIEVNLRAENGRWQTYHISTKRID